MALKPDGGDDDEKTDWHSRSRTRYQTGLGVDDDEEDDDGDDDDDQGDDDESSLMMPTWQSVTSTVRKT